MSQIAVEHCCEIGTSLRHTHNCTLCGLWNMRVKASWISKWPADGVRMFLCNGCKASGVGSSGYMLKLVELRSSERP